MEAYCSYEVSKLLKEKGMDEKYFTYYIQKNNTDGTSEAVTTCTHQMALAWLRQKHNINIEIHFNRYGPNYKYEIIYKPEILDDIYSTGNYLYYEDTVEAALEDVLKHLI